jgi:predicted extracellular nuclease
MKKVLLVSLIALGHCVSAQTYLPLKDFQDQSLTSGGWANQAVVGSYNWSVSNTGSPSDYYLKASGYNATTMAGDNAEIWFISPTMNLTTATNPMLNFNSAKNYSGLPIAVKVSTNYSAGAPSTAAWTDITSSCALSTGGFAFVNSGNVSLSTYNGAANVRIAFVYASTTTGAATWQVDDIQALENGVTAPPMSIAQVQATTGGDLSNMAGQLVTVGGRVSAFKVGSGFFIQDGTSGFSGIYVYDFGNNAVAIGDSVLVSGSVVEYAPGASTEKTTQISGVTSFTNVGAYTAYPALNLSTLDVNGEMYESMLVKVSNAGVTAIPDSFNEWTVSDGTGPIKVDDFMYLTAPAPAVSAVYNVTGVVNHSFAAFKILPRNAADVELVFGAGLDEEASEEIVIYPNPSNGVINVKNANNATIDVYNTLGAKVLSTKQTQITLKSGLYLIQVEGKTFRVFVK